MLSRRALVGLVFGILFLGYLCEAATQRPMSLTELVKRADVIVVGRVTSQTTVWNAEHTHILTRTTFQVEEALKGAPSNVLVIETIGGVLDGIGMIASGAPTFRPGERDVVFLSQDARSGGHRVTGWEQGRFRVIPDRLGGRERVSRNLAGITLMGGVSANSATAPGSVTYLDELKSAIRQARGRF